MGWAIVPLIGNLILIKRWTSNISKIGLVHRPKENQNYRLTWARAFNTPTNQALFLDIFVTRVSVFKVYAQGADGGYVFPRDSVGNPYWYNPYEGIYAPVDTSNSIYFYPSTDPKIEGFYGMEVKDLPEIKPEIVNSWEFGYKGRLTTDYLVLWMYTQVTTVAS